MPCISSSFKTHWRSYLNNSLLRSCGNRLQPEFNKFIGVLRHQLIVFGQHVQRLLTYYRRIKCYSSGSNNDMMRATTRGAKGQLSRSLYPSLIEAYMFARIQLGDHWIHRPHWLHMIRDPQKNYERISRCKNINLLQWSKIVHRIFAQYSVTSIQLKVVFLQRKLRNQLLKT